jgi:hypothetical protein
MDLLVCCAAVPGRDTGVNERIRQIVSAGIDWTRLIDHASRQCIFPLVYSALKRSSVDVPPADWNEICAVMRQYSASGVFLTSELFRLVELLAAEGITALPLKGSTVAVTAYGSVSMRQFRDIDLYVQPVDVLRAKRVLMTDAYDFRGLLNPAQEAIGLHTHRYHYQFRRRDGAATVELHWGLCEWFLPFSESLDRLFEGLVPIRLGRRTLMGLAPENLLQYLCLHGAKHSWSRLRLVADVAWLIHRRANWNWDQVVSLARANHLERVLVSGLFLASDLLGAEVPPAVIKDVWSPASVRRVKTDAWRRLTAPSRDEPGFLANLGFHLRLLSRVTDKARCCTRVFLENTVFGWAVRPLPPRALPVYGLLAHARTPSTRALALLAVAFVARVYYLLLPVARGLRNLARMAGRSTDTPSR